ncbi:MAG: glycosyltransferase family 2 protein [Burkholderiales bacterium]
MPRVSIIMAVYNGERHVGESLDSLSGQSFRDTEIIVVNDGSTDGTVDIVERHAARDPRIRLVSRQASGRPSFPRNDGLALSKGEYVGFLDHDDTSDPERISVLVKALDAHPHWVAAFHDLDLIDEEGGSRFSTWFSHLRFVSCCADHFRAVDGEWLESLPSFPVYASLHTPGMMTQSILIAKDRFSGRLAFDTAYRICDDTDLWIRIALDGPVGFVNRPYGAYRARAGSLMTQRAAYLRDTAHLHTMNFERVKERFEADSLRRYRERIAGHYANLAWYHYDRLEPGCAREALRSVLAWHALPEYRRMLWRSYIPVWLLRFARAVARRP